VFKRLILPLKIPIPTQSDNQKLEQLLDIILLSLGKDIFTAEEEINKLIYDLYDLNNEERDFIEHY
jgi:hypothetical protein